MKYYIGTKAPIAVRQTSAIRQNSLLALKALFKFFLSPFT